MMQLYIDAPQKLWEATCVMRATRQSIVASISVGSDAVGSTDDPGTGTVDGKYSSPPTRGSRALNFNVDSEAKASAEQVKFW